MATTPHLFGVVFVVTGLVSLLFLRPTLRYRHNPGSTGFAAVVLGMALWSITNGVMKFVGGLAATIWVFNVSEYTVQVVAVGWFVLAIEFTEWRPLSRRLVGALVGLVALDQLVIWTNPLHHQFLGAGTTISGGVLRPETGVWYWVHVGLAYVLVLLGTGLLVREALESRGLRRTQAVALSFASVPPLIASIVTVFDLAFVPYDVTPFGFVVSTVLFGWALYSGRFLDVAPIGRQTVVERLDEAVVVLDDENRVVDCNETAQRLLDAPEAYVGTPASRFFSPAFADAVSRVMATTGTESDAEVSTTLDGDTRHFLVSTSTVENDSGRHVGRTVVIRDVTSLKRRERALRAREEELDLLRQVLSRALRHNLRNELTTITGNAEYLEMVVESPLDERAHAIVDAGEELADLSEKARVVEQLVEDDTQTGSFELGPIVETAVDDVRARYPAAEIEVDDRARSPVRATVGLEAAVFNLVENAVEHNDDDPSVSVTIRDADETVTLTIVDDGPGIPDHEISVLEAGEETPLKHGTGIGLWLVDWVVARADADIEFAASDDGTTVTVQFEPAAHESPTD